MKFDFSIGNPPYQESTEGTSDKPVYNFFMDEAYKIADKVVLITPARFLFDAGKTSKAWNEKMLYDKHLKVLEYESDSRQIFPNTDITGGIAITYRDNNKEIGPIGIYSNFSEINSILPKIIHSSNNRNITNFIFQQSKFELNTLLNDYPNYKNIIGSNGTEKRLTTKIFDQLDVFAQSKQNPTDYEIYGLVNNKRVSRYIPQKYISKNKWQEQYKVVVPSSNGSGAIGEVIPTPLIGQPFVGKPNSGFTQSFIGFGPFISQDEAENCLKYIKSKFARCMLGILKVTQHNHLDTWKYVPLQDFSSNSDIDWNVSIANIDRQLYKKYGLSDEEINFIETHVKEME